MSQSIARVEISPEARRNRIAALQALSILDTPPEEGFDALTTLAALVCEAPVAIISLIDGERLWFKSVYGVDARTIPSEHSFCVECANSREVLQVTNARDDARFSEIGLVTGPLQVQFYAGAPIMFGGSAIGTICVLDSVIRELKPGTIHALKEMAKIAASMLRARAEAFRLLQGGVSGFTPLGA
ncbi:MAG: GAF domain-containing protein [Caldimonas sp.]